MKYFQQVLSFTIVIFLLAIPSCKENTTEPVKLKNVVVSGQVTLVQENPFLLDLQSGVAVLLDGTPYGTITDSLGNWTLSGVPSGTYNVSISFPGYAPSKYLNFEFNQDTTIFYSSLGPVPSFNVINVAVSVTNDSVIFLGTLSNVAPYQRTVDIYFSADSTVSYRHLRYGIGTNSVAVSSSTFRLGESVALLKINGFPTSGMRVYAAAYGVGHASYVYDMSHSGGGYETDISTSAARASFLMP